jgi:DNA modification methylase
MNKVFEDEVCVVYNNDYRDIIEQLKFDYIITDPPYNINYKYNNYKDKLEEKEYIELLKPLSNKKIVFIHHINTLIKYFCIPNQISPSDNYVWCYNSNLPRQHRDIVLFDVKANKKNVGMEYKNKTDKRIQKRIAEGKQRQMTSWFDDIQLIKNVSKEKVKDFTNQIPIKLLERIILLISKEGDIILDTFGGTGSLYFACKNLNRKCILIEKHHTDILVDRITKCE